MPLWDEFGERLVVIRCDKAVKRGFRLYSRIINGLEYILESKNR